MKWFAAHNIFYFRFKDGVQDTYPVWENIYLIEADGFDEARDKAAALGQQSAGDSSGTLHFVERPAELVFAGVRKVVSCVEEDERPKDGTEITYSDFEVADRASLDDLAQGRSVVVRYGSTSLEDDEAEKG